MKWKIGNVEIKNQIVMAPMAGISSPPYMKICEEMGVGYAITELISAEAIVRGNKKTLEMLEGYEKLSIPVAIQLFGSDPEILAKASVQVVRVNPNVIIETNLEGLSFPESRAFLGYCSLKVWTFRDRYAL